MSDHIFYCPKCGDVAIEFDENEHFCITCRKTKMINTGKDSNYFRAKYFEGKEMCDEVLFKYDLTTEVYKEYKIDKNPLYDLNAAQVKEDLAQRVIAKNLKETSSIQTNNIPRCPTCGSEKIHKISTANKVVRAGLLGIFSLGQISKTFECDNCHYKW